jgi:hypothetical protein
MPRALVATLTMMFGPFTGPDCNERKAMRPKIADSLCDKCYTAVEHVAGSNDDWERCAAKNERATRQALAAGVKS